MTQDDDDAVARLLDRAAITDLLYLRARAADHRDLDLALSCYHEGATEDHEGFTGTAEQFLKEVSLTARPDSPIRMMWHFLSNIVIAFVSTDAARVESYHIAAVGHEQDGREALSLIGGRYLDDIERRAGAWKIAHRHVVFDWSKSEIDPVPYWTLMNQDVSAMAMGSFGPDDPIYGEFGVTRGA